MASAVAEKSDHSAARSASWSAMHSDEELARILQMQEEEEYQDHLTAKELQCESDLRMARLLSEGKMDVDEFVETEPPARPSSANRSSSNSAGHAVATNSQTANVISTSDDSNADFSDCFEDTTTFDELAGVLERAQNEAEQLVEQQEVADTCARDREIAEALQNDEQMNEMLENEGALTGSNREFGDASSNPIVLSPLSTVNSGSTVTCSDGSSLGDWVSGLFSGVQPPLQFNFGEDDGEDEEDDVDLDTEEDSEQCDEDDDDDDDDDDEDEDDDEMDSDTDETDGDSVEISTDFGDASVSGLVQDEIDVLPTRTYQTRHPRPPTATAAATNAGASANEHHCQNECQVCLSSFVDGEVLRTLPCCHQFHSNCIDTWIQRNAICPVCRVRIRDEIGY